MARAFISLTQARVLLEVNGELKNHWMPKFFGGMDIFET